MNPHNLLKKLLSGLALVAFAGGHFSALASTFPEQPIRFIVPFNAGSSVDGLARALGAHMSRELGQPIIVENKPGANAAIGAMEVAKAKPDGYTLFFASDSALVLNGLLYKKLPYEPAKDFKGIGLAANVPLVVVVNSKLPVKDINEFVAYAKAHPGELNYGSTGNGGAYHMATELFSQAVGVEMVHVPYSGGAPALQALAGGHVDVMFGVVGSALPYITSGRLRPLAVVTGERVNALEGVPTLKERGYPGLEAMVRYGLVAPAGTPQVIIERLNAALDSTITDQAYRERYTREGYVIPQAHSDGEFDKWLEQDRVMWAKLIESRGLALD